VYLAQGERGLLFDVDTWTSTLLDVPPTVDRLSGWFEDGSGLVLCDEGSTCALVPLGGAPTVVRDVAAEFWKRDPTTWTVDTRVGEYGRPNRLEYETVSGPRQERSGRSHLAVDDRQVRPATSGLVSVGGGSGGHPELKVVGADGPLDHSLVWLEAGEIRSHGWSSDGSRLAWIVADSPGFAGTLVTVRPFDPDAEELVRQVRAAWWRPTGPSTATRFSRSSTDDWAPPRAPESRPRGPGLLLGYHPAPGPMSEVYAHDADTVGVRFVDGSAIARVSKRTGAVADKVWLPQSHRSAEVLQPDDGRLFSLSRRGAVVELVGKEWIERLPDTGQRLSGLAVSEDRRFLTAREQMSVFAWDLSSWSQVGSLETRVFMALPEGDFLVQHRGVLCRWTPGSAPSPLPWELGGAPAAPTTRIGFVDRPRTWVLGSDEPSYWEVWSSHADRRSLRDGRVLETRTGSDIQARLSGLSPDGRFSLVRRDHERVTFLAEPSGEVIVEVAAATRRSSWSEDGHTVLCVHPDTVVHLWDVSGLYEGGLPTPHDAEVGAPSSRADIRYVIPDRDERIRLAAEACTQAGC